MAEIENLSISIGAHADEAFVAFDRLISKLNRTKIELKAFAAGAVVSALKEIKSNASAAASALNRFANAQERANRAMGGFTGAGYTSTMRGAASDANTATNAITRFVNAMATAQSAMQRMRYANPYGSNRPYAPTQPRLTGEVQEPIETTFVDDNSGDLNGSDHEEPGVRRFNLSMQSLRDTLRSILQPLGDVGKQLGSVFAAGARRAAHSLAGFFSGLLRIAKFRIFRTIVKDLGQSFKDLYGWSNAFGTDFAGSMDKITTAFTYLRNSIAAMTAPLVNALAPALDYIIDKVVDVLNWFNQLFAAIGGQDTYTVAKKVAVSFGDTLTSTSRKAKKAADEIKRTILGFDEINKLVSPKDNSNSSRSGSSPYSKNYKMMFEEKPLSSGFKGFSDAIEKSLNDTLSRIGLIISGASLAVGAILTFSGANVPLGLSMMAAGASGLVSIIGMNWDGLSADVKLAIGAVEAVVGGSLLAIGGVLAFSGVNVPLGIAMMAAGAVSLAASIGLNWGLLTGKVSASAKGVVGAISAASIALGAILAFTGANVPLGVGLLAAGVTGAVATISWDWLKNKLRGQVATITTIVSGALLALGAVLAFSGAAIPLGIGMMAAGAVGLAVTATANWNTITNKLRGPLGIATALIGGALLVLGAVAVASGHIPLGVGLLVAGSAGLATSIAANWGRLTTLLKGPIGTITALISGALLALGFVAVSAGRVPLGIGLLVAGAAGLATTIAAKWDRLKDFIKGPIGTITALISGATLALGFVAIAAGRIPLGLGLIVTGAVGLATTLTANWDILREKLQGPIGAITGILSGATLLLGILALVSGNIPLGIGLILSGATGLATTIAANWDNIVDLGSKAIEKVKEGWEKGKTLVVDIVVKIAGKIWDGVTSFWDWLWGKGGNVQSTGIIGSKDKMAEITATVDAFAGKNMIDGASKFSGGLAPDVRDVDAIANIAADPEWGWAWNLLGYLGINNLDTSVWVDAETPWGYWHRSPLEWLGLSNLSTVVSVTAKVVGSVAGVVGKIFGKATGGVYSGGRWSDIPQYAGGTAGVNHGSLFWAGENGAEIVGNAGGRTEVLNKSQIASAMYSAVQAAMAPAAANFAAAAENMGVVETGFDFETLADMVRQGVEQAMSRSNDYDRQKVELLRSINDKNFNVDVSTASINKAQSRMNRRAGVTIAPVGT